MAFDKYKNGAWTEPEDSVRRYDKASGTWVECDSANRYKDGAWQEVWTGIPVMTIRSCNLVNGTIDISNDKKTFEITRYEDKGQQVGSLSGSGAIQFEITGEWTDGVQISLDWYGGMNYWHDGITSCSGELTGSVRVEGYDSNMNSQGSQHATIGKTHVTDSSVIYYDGTLTKVYPTTAPVSKIILTISTVSHTGSYNYGESLIQISNFTINGEPIGFPPEAESYSKYINDYA